MNASPHFIILTTPRSGSSWLSSLLDDHPDLQVYGELFLKHAVPKEYEELRAKDPDKFFQFRAKNKVMRPGATYTYLDHVFEKEEGGSGFKLMAAPLIKHPEIILYCNKNDIKVIYLTRPAEERALSYAVAERRNYFHKIKQDIDKEEKIELNLKRVQNIYFKQRILSKTLNILVNAIRSPLLTISYSQLVQNAEKTVQDIYTFLGIKEHAASSEFKKLSETPYSDQIKNYDDVMKVFKQ